MKNQITDKTIIALPLPVFWSLVVMLVVASGVSTAAFVSIKADIETLGRTGVTHEDFNIWADQFRKVNEPLHIQVPLIRSKSGDSRRDDGKQTAMRPEAALARRED